jgi:hypothetical protein
VSDSPTLRASIKDSESRKPVWIHIINLDLNEHVEWISYSESTDIEGTLQDKIRSELDTRFTDLSIRPGWRVVVLQHPRNDMLDVIFTWNHATTDGMGGKLFHDKLLEALATERHINTTARVGYDRKLYFPSLSDRFPPATESLVDLPTSTGFLLQQAWNETKPHWLFPDPSTTIWAPIRRGSCFTKFRVFELNNATLSGVLKTCRARKTTLTAVIHGMVLLSLIKQLGNSTVRAFTSLTAIDQRRFLPSYPASYPWLEPKTTMANYVTNITHEFDERFVAQVQSCLGGQSHGELLSSAQLDFVWSGAVLVRKDIEKRLHKELRDDRLALMKFVRNARAIFEKDVKKPRLISWAVSNLGVINGATKGDVNVADKIDGSWSIRRAQFTLSAHIPGAVFLVDVMSLKGGELVITCSWQDQVVEDIIADRLMGDLNVWMTQVGALEPVV